MPCHARVMLPQLFLGHPWVLGLGNVRGFFLLRLGCDDATLVGLELLVVVWGWS